MKLRDLQIEDAQYMLEWMHDDNVVHYLHTDFASKTLSDCEEFIMNSHNKNEIHYAITSVEDEYMGTVSLKNINNIEKIAEFAIVVRSKAMGKGYSWFGMQEILNRAFNEFGLEKVFWCVSKENSRAVRFYEKHSFREAINVPKAIFVHYRGVANLKWFYASYVER